MEIIGNRKYVEIAGQTVHELPPLLLKDKRSPTGLDEMMQLAEEIVRSEDLLAESGSGALPGDRALDHQKYGLALNLAEQYVGFLSHWYWGASVLEWIRQCETTFEAKPALRPLLRPDVWPHAGRSSFVTLLSDKAVPPSEIDVENAVGFRLTFRQPPPIEFFSEKFLFFLNRSLAGKAYESWSAVSGDMTASLPPERFHFLVMGTEIKEV